jgi:hypothetical protein
MELSERQEKETFQSSCERSFQSPDQIKSEKLLGLREVSVSPIGGDGCVGEGGGGGGRQALRTWLSVGGRI